MMKLPTITCPADLDKMPWSKNQDWDRDAPLIRHVDLFCIDESKPYALRKAVAERLVAITDPGSEGPMSDEVFTHYLGVTREMITREPQLLIEPTEHGVRATAKGPATKH